jgi:hypothetical protein
MMLICESRANQPIANKYETKPTKLAGFSQFQMDNSKFFGLWQEEEFIFYKTKFGFNKIREVVFFDDEFDFLPEMIFNITSCRAGAKKSLGGRDDQKSSFYFSGYCVFLPSRRLRRNSRATRKGNCG